MTMCNNEDDYSVSFIAQAILDAINTYRSKQSLKPLTLANMARTQIAQNYACKLVQSSNMNDLSVKNSALLGTNVGESLGIDGCPLGEIDMYAYTWSQNSKLSLYIFLLYNQILYNLFDVTKKCVSCLTRHSKKLKF